MLHTEFRLLCEALLVENSPEHEYPATGVLTLCKKMFQWFFPHLILDTALGGMIREGVIMIKASLHPNISPLP